MTTHKQSEKSKCCDAEISFHKVWEGTEYEACSAHPICKKCKKKCESICLPTSRESTEDWEKEVSTSDFLFWDEDCKQNFLDRAKLRNYVKSLLLQERQRAADIVNGYIQVSDDAVSKFVNGTFEDIKKEILNPETN